MHRISRRLSPSLIIAFVALFAALYSTASAAGLLVTSPSQLKDGVVTGPKIALDAVTSDKVARDSLTRNDIADRAITNRELNNPIFTAAVASDGTVSTAQSAGVEQSLTRKVEQIGGGVVYDVGFQQDISQCVISATPGTVRTDSTFRAVTLNVVVRQSRPNVVQVFVRDSSGSLVTDLRSAFHLVVVC